MLRLPDSSSYYRLFGNAPELFENAPKSIKLQKKLHSFIPPTDTAIIIKDASTEKMFVYHFTELSGTAVPGTAGQRTATGTSLASATAAGGCVLLCLEVIKSSSLIIKKSK